MDIHEILNALQYNEGRFPREALEAAIANKELIVPELLAILERAIENSAELVEQPKYMAHVYAMLLLAQFREERAYPLILRFFSQPGDVSIEATGDGIFNLLSRILASVSGGDDGPLKQLIENTNAYGYVRWAAIDSLVVLVACGQKSRDEVMAYFLELFRGKLTRVYSEAWNGLVCSALDLYPEEVSEDIVKCLDEELADSFVVGPESVAHVLEQGKQSVLDQLSGRKHYSLVDDVIGEMEWWDCFKQPESYQKTDQSYKKAYRKLLAEQKHNQPKEHKEPYRVVKIGRNEPCPCGSGKKYKKCCGMSGASR